MGREGVEPPVSEDHWSTASCAPWRDRPISGRMPTGPNDDVSAVVKVLVARLEAWREQTREESNLLVVGFGDRDATTGSSLRGHSA